MGMWANQLEEDINSGDTSLIIYDLVQAACLFGSFCAKCFTGDTLVATEDGFTRIDEIEVGDYVLAENVETGEKEYKRVTKVYVKEATEVVHVKTDAKEDSDQTIDTTANHPFYVEGTGWVAAINIEAGDKLHTESGVVVTVTSVATEKLTKPIKVYNLEVEDFHTYYVTEDEVLVHNSYGENKPNQIHHFATNKSKKYTRQFMNIANKYGLDLDEEWNKELLPHQGRHAYAYHDYVLDNMQKFDKIAKGDKKKFLELYNQMKKRIINTPEMLYKNYWNKK